MRFFFAKNRVDLRYGDVFNNPPRLITSTDFKRLTMSSGTCRASDADAFSDALKSFAASSTTARSSGERFGLFPYSIESNKCNRAGTELR
jgi:hypothetical protein